ncbi:MAG: D-2-hydroxyacid dehydrogenase [Deltaproteobacteria bacterium]|nr:D-2-hydroxyacid dehydrogenase [Deltaproteobacteria bacterium]
MTSRILALHDTPADFADLLAQRCADAEVRFATRAEEVASSLAGFRPTAVLSIKHSGFPGEVHAPAVHAPGVQWFHVGGSGFEHLGTWDPSVVQVTHSAGVLAPFLAEMTLAAMLSLATGLPLYARDQRERAWRPRRFRSLASQTLLIVGVGATGGELAHRARALGMTVLGIRASAEPHPAVHAMHGPQSLRSLLPQADIVSVHARAGAATRGLVGRDEFEAMKHGALFLNSSRGAIVDERALIDALQSRHLGGAWLDVFAVEPLPSESPLWSLPNVLITPHCADQVTDFPRRFAQRFCDLRDALLRGEPLPALSPPD